MANSAKQLVFLYRPDARMLSLHVLYMPCKPIVNVSLPYSRLVPPGPGCAAGSVEQVIQAV